MSHTLNEESQVVSLHFFHRFIFCVPLLSLTQSTLKPLQSKNQETYITQSRTYGVFAEQFKENEEKIYYFFLTCTPLSDILEPDHQ